MIDAIIYNKLSNYCASKERSVADARSKLYALKVAADSFDDYIKRLQNENFLNEERYVKAFIETFSRKKWGKNKMKSALFMKRIDAGLIKKYLDKIEDEDYTDQIKVLAQKKLKSLRTGTEREKNNKLIRFLLSKGFEMSKIKDAIKNS
jgi:regulatory protein